jgi:hypothetical protein
MNHYVIRDSQDSPQSTVADTLDSALATLGLDQKRSEVVF